MVLTLMQIAVKLERTLFSNRVTLDILSRKEYFIFTSILYIASSWQIAYLEAVSTRVLKRRGFVQPSAHISVGSCQFLQIKLVT